MAIIEQIKSHFDNTLNLNSYIILGTRILGPGGSYLFWVLAARLMLPKDVGLASGVIASAGLIAGIAQLGVGYGMVRYLPDSKHPKELINVGIEVVSGSAFIFGVVYILGLQVWSPALVPLREKTWVVLCFLTFPLSYAINHLLDWVFLSKRKPIFALIQAAIQTLFSIIILVALSEKGLTFEAPILAYVLSLALSCCTMLFFFLPIQQPGYRLALTRPASLGKKLMRYSFINFLADLFQRAPDTLMILLVINLLGPATGAYFFAAWSVARGLQLMAASVAPALLAEGTNSPEMIITYTYRALKLGSGFAVVLALLALIFGRIILSTYGTSYFENGWVLFILLVVSTIPGVAYPVYLNVLRVQNRLKFLTIISSICLCLELLLMYLFIGYFGLVGAGIAWLLSRLVIVFLITVAWIFHNLNIDFPVKATQVD